MASVMQTLFSLPSFQSYYFPTSSHHWESCTELLPADCIDCQMHKLADGLLSGRYSHPSQSQTSNPFANDSSIPVFQDGLRPAGFKALVGKGHNEFSTMSQQDSEEFFTYLLQALRRSFKRSPTVSVKSSDPTEVFSFGMEQRLECGDCKKVRYRVDGMDVVSIAVTAKEKAKDEEGKIIYEDVLLKNCLTRLAEVEALEYTCPSCGRNVIATK
jgi:ubiquitin carboxyl-terminal hydrolase 5/13